jgi:hypothetical protein
MGQVTTDTGDVLINNNSYWHMETVATVQPTGNIYGYTHTWDTDQRPWGTGFHGAVVLTVVDQNWSLLYYTQPSVYGVSGGWDFTGPHAREEPLQGQMDVANVPQVAHIMIAQWYDPQSQFVKEVEDSLLQAMGKSTLELVAWLEQKLGAAIHWITTTL